VKEGKDGMKRIGRIRLNQKRTGIVHEEKDKKTPKEKKTLKSACGEKMSVKRAKGICRYRKRSGNFSIPQERKK